MPVSLVLSRKPRNEGMFQCWKIINPKFYSKAFFDFIRNILPPKITCYMVLLVGNSDDIYTGHRVYVMQWMNTCDEKSLSIHDKNITGP